MATAAYSKARYERLKVEGRCVSCARKLFPGDASRCEDCMAKQYEAVKARRARDPKVAEANREYMRDHYAANREEILQAHKDRREERKISGTCQRCPEPALEDSNLCAVHTESERARGRDYWRGRRGKMVAIRIVVMEDA